VIIMTTKPISYFKPAAPVGVGKTISRELPETVGTVAPTPTQAIPLPPRQSQIATAAYYRAAQRDFAPGHELADWLAAEREIDDGSPREIRDGGIRDVSEELLAGSDRTPARTPGAAHSAR
jgi:Protein of unknown function (DUF2934)